MNNEQKRKFQIIVGKQCGSFYYDAEKFIQSKRFIRFENVVEQRIEELIQGIVESENNGLIPKTTKDFIKDAVISYTDEISLGLKISAVPVVSDIDIIGTLLRTSGYSVVRCVCPRVSAIQMMMPDGGDDNVTALYIEAILALLEETSLFNSIYSQALAKACYDYIQEHALSMQLVDENWFGKLKTFAEAETLTFLTRIFENVLSSADELAFLMLERQKASVIDKIQSANEYENEIVKLKQAIIKTNETVEAQNEQLKKRDETITQLNRQLFEVNNATVTKEDNTALLSQKLKKKDAELEQFREKYNELQAYADSLQQLLEDEPTYEEIEIPEMTADELAKRLQNERIVFVRDKKNESYDVMAKLAELFPNARFTNCIASDINARATDLILVFTPYVCHGTYWNACSIARRKNIPLIAMKNTNVNIITQRINAFFELSNASKGEV